MTTFRPPATAVLVAPEDPLEPDAEDTPDPVLVRDVAAAPDDVLLAVPPPLLPPIETEGTGPTAGVLTDGRLIEDEPPELEPPGSGNGGVLTDGVLTDGVETGGVLPTGVDTEGTVTDGTETEGTFTEGTLSAPADPVVRASATAIAAPSTQPPDTFRGVDLLAAGLAAAGSLWRLLPIPIPFSPCLESVPPDGPN